ncbi:glycosyltransferase family 4 protein [Variovorax dokdonensis]|uniref:Glycosyltransferase family 4 protein n=1 Tax=Variovorax dokdonensis TaxID=344883 RepID=A0ABT7N5N5_9BURK|nr:glycosyltransferase family 4 protein [Variovorax dokdonensis]MDM0043264.1 glycosyltransferase family 4 protein [Variovorax dokdonensis]
MQTVHFLYPGSLAMRTGGTIYDRRIVEGLRESGWQVHAQSLGEGFPFPDAATMTQARARVESLPDDSLVLVDGLAFGVLDATATEHAARLRWIALVHHPLALEAGLRPSQQQALLGSERRALGTARGVIVTSPGTVDDLTPYDVDRQHVRVVLPGTDRAALSAGTAQVSLETPLQLLCVASITPRKAHAVLVEALAGLKDRHWHLHCAGSEQMDAACAAQLRAAIESHGLAERVTMHGEQDDDGLARRYAAADVFVLPSLHEGYGMALAEALARGLPIVSTRAGAIPGTVPPDAGMLVPPGDVPALRAALARVMDDAAWRSRLHAGAVAARHALPDWRQSAERFALALQDFAKAPLRSATTGANA